MLTYFETKQFHLPEGLIFDTFLGDSRPEILREIETLRVRVWRASGFPISPEHEDDTHWGDDWDKVGNHFVVTRNSSVMAARRITVHNSVSETPYPEWFANLSPMPSPPLLYCSRLVVDPEFQRQGLSDFFDKKCVDFARGIKAGAILIDVPEYRIEPLKRRGFELTSDPKLGVLFPTMRFSGMILRIEG